MSSCPTSQSESWESEMSESVAHLVSAYVSVRRLRAVSPWSQLQGVSLDLASQGICTALIALDECGMTAPREVTANGTSSESGGQECLLTLYAELGLMS